MGRANPALAETFWKIPSDFAETLNYSQVLLPPPPCPLTKCQE